MGGGKKGKGGRTVVRNRKARYEYHIDETWEAGIVLLGSEIKSIRDGKMSLDEAYVRVRDGEATLVGAHIAGYPQAPDGGHDPRRPRRLLLHRREISKIERALHQKGYTVVPLDVHFTRGRAKVQIGLARGKQSHDKRRTIKERDDHRQAQRELRRRR